MKKTAIFALMFCLLFTNGAALASPAAHSAYRLSFQGNMAEIYMEPIGRWMDEFLALVTLRAECVSWDGGSMTRLDFYIEDVSAASLSVIELSDDMYLSGSLFPEMPYLFDEEQRTAAAVLCEALFPPFNGPIEAGEVQISAGEYADHVRDLAALLRSSALPEETSALAFIDMLDKFANKIARDDRTVLAITVTRTPDEEGSPALLNASYVANATIERLLRSLITAIANKVES